VAKRRRTDNPVAKRRRTDNTVAKRRRTKEQTTIYKIYTTKDRVTRTPLSGPSLKTQKFETYIILGNYSYYWILYEFSVKM
jgi:hypothetical protein